MRDVDGTVFVPPQTFAFIEAVTAFGGFAGKSMREIAAALGDCDAVPATEAKRGYVLTWSRPGYELKLTFDNHDHAVKSVDSKLGGPASRGLKARMAEEEEAAAAAEELRRAVSKHLAHLLEPPLEVSVDGDGEVIVHAHNAEIASVVPTCAWAPEEISGDFLKDGDHWAELADAIEYRLISLNLRRPPPRVLDTPLGRALLDHLPEQFEDPFDVLLLPNGNLSLRNIGAEIAVLAPASASVDGKKIRGDFLRDGEQWNRLTAAIDARIYGLNPSPPDPATRAKALLTDDDQRQLLIAEINLAAAFSLKLRVHQHDGGLAVSPTISSSPRSRRGISNWITLVRIPPANFASRLQRRAPRSSTSLEKDRSSSQ